MKNTCSTHFVKSFLSILLLSCLLLYSSCDLCPSPNGVIRVTIGESLHTRSLNIEPEGADLDIQTYTFTLTKDEKTITLGPIDKVEGAVCVIDALSVGSWVMQVEGKNSGGNIVAQLQGGSLSVPVQRGKVTEVDARIVPCSGTGTLSLNLAIDGDYESLFDPAITVSIVDSEGDQLHFASYSIPSTGLEDQIIPLGARWYHAHVQLKDGDAVLDTQDFFPRIIEGMETSRYIMFTVGP